MTKDKGTVPFQRQRTVKTHQCFYSVCVQCSYRKIFIAEKYVFFFCRDAIDATIIWV